MSRKDFESLIKDVADNLNKNKFKTSVDGKAYDLRNAKKFLVKITTQKISQKEALELYSDLIAPYTTELEKWKGKDKDKRSNILNVLKNLQSVLAGVYLNYSNKPPEFKESIAERTKLRIQRSDETAKKGNWEYLEYLSPSDMYKKLNKKTGYEENQIQVNTIKDTLADLMEKLKSNSTSDVRKIKNKNVMLNIVELILELNQLNQLEKGLKILTPSQMVN